MFSIMKRNTFHESLLLHCDIILWQITARFLFVYLQLTIVQKTHLYILLIVQLILEYHLF